MPKVRWTGVFPAVTTLFRPDQSVDYEETQKHVQRLIEAGVHGLIMLGTVGENTALEPDEKRAVLDIAVKTAGGRLPVLAGVAECSTKAACRFADDAATLGVDGLMVLPAMVYKADGREAVTHLRAVTRTTALPVMVYNNPVSYGVDITPQMLAELSDEETIVAVKESSDDVRRITDVINLCGERYVLFCGVDDLVLESVLLGVTGWVAGLVNAFPRESVRLWELARAGQWEEARALYRWFAPLLHLDTRPKLVQYIKLAQAMSGFGSETVRAPRLVLEGEERTRVESLVRAARKGSPVSAAEQRSPGHSVVR
jgi:4-hydroxy-tetrahydrodipicolinate synthase